MKTTATLFQYKSFRIAVPAVIIYSRATGVSFVAVGVCLLVFILIQATALMLLATGVIAAAVVCLYILLPKDSSMSVGQRGNTRMTIDRFQAGVTNRLERLIIEHGVHCKANVIRGPFSVTYRLFIVRDVTNGIKTLLGLQKTLEMIMQSPVRITQGAQGILVEVQLPENLQRTPNAAKLAAFTKPDRIPLGIDQFGRIVGVNPFEHGAMAWIAPPRRGKTVSMKSTLYLMLKSDPSLQFMICALPAKIQQDWGCFAGLKGCLGLVGDPDEMTTALEWVTEAMSDQSLSNRIVVLLDDLANLTSRVDLGKYVDEIGLAGAGLGVHLIMGTHSGGSRAATAGTLVQNAQTCKMLYKASDANTASRSSGRKNADTGLDQLSGRPGDGILDLNGAITRVATAWVSDRDILSLPVGASPLRPWAVTDASPDTDLWVTRHQPVTDLFDTVTRGSEASPSPSPANRPPHVDSAAAATRGGRGDGDAVTVTPPAGMFPLENGRGELTDDEAKILQRMIATDPSQTPTGLTVMVYGAKSSRRLKYVNEALSRRLGADEEMTTELAISILEANDVDDPRRTEALTFLRRDVTIAGKSWNEKGPRKTYA